MRSRKNPRGRADEDARARGAPDWFLALNLTQRPVRRAICKFIGRRGDPPVLANCELSRAPGDRSSGRRPRLRFPRASRFSPPRPFRAREGSGTAGAWRGFDRGNAGRSFGATRVSERDSRERRVWRVFVRGKLGICWAYVRTLLGEVACVRGTLFRWINNARTMMLYSILYYV